LEFWLLNLLNLGDSVLTHVALENGAREANPVVRFIGLHGKVALVLAATLLLNRIQPKAMWAAIPALGAVVMYSSFHLSWL